MPLTFPAFVARWQKSGAEERANKDLFFTELCDVLDVPRPHPKTGDPARDTYVFEKDVRIPHEGGTTSIGWVDLYKEGHVLIEAKQGKGDLSRKLGTAKRGTPAWNVAMADAYGQALGYARTLERPPPFLVTTDIGHCFDLYASFDGTATYRPFPNAMATRIFFADLEKHADTLRRIFLDPHGLDPAKQSAKVTREVATHLAELARALEEAGQAPESVATFLMRCLFTMFAEDVNLLPPRLFTDALEQHWLESPASFPAGIEALWRAMNTGTDFGFMGKLLRFNGGLFATPRALPLTRAHLALLLEAAKCNWADVEPAIFGTLLERALDPTERHALGAHYTPRAYVERLVRPTIEEPLRADWEIVQGEVRGLVAEAAGIEVTGPLTAEQVLAIGQAGHTAKKKAKTAQEAARSKKLNEARAVLRAFHKKLATLRVLDPACGSGNFLYVTLDLFQRLEGEVLAALEGLGDKQELLRADAIRVTPAQFLGIEVKRWAKEIADLVLWIGYLQHHFKTYGKNMPVPEPVLQDYQNIECRDAVLAWDSLELARDEKGKPTSRWDRVTYKKNPITGKKIPDATAQVLVERYVGARPATWPSADYVIGNPPFVANRNMPQLLRQEYVEALKAAYPDITEAAEFVMVFWNKAAQAVASGAVRRAGLITTSRIRMQQNQGVVRRALSGGCRLLFAIPDHPWPGDPEDAEVRISMTVLAPASTPGTPRLLLTPIHDKVARGKNRLMDVAEQDLIAVATNQIPPDLSPSIEVSDLAPLASNDKINSAGVKPYSRSLVITAAAAKQLIPDARKRRRYAPEYRNGEDIGQWPRGVRALDLFGMTEEEIGERLPVLYQYLLDHAKPERAEERNARLRRDWWLFEANRAGMRRALASLSRYVVTVENSPVRAFVFLDGAILPDQKLRVIASDDALVLGVLSSRVHSAFALRLGGRHGVRNTPVYNTRCFTHFPFPAGTRAQHERIRTLGERLDKHRKDRQALHPHLALTDMYNVLEKVAGDAELTASDREVYERGLVAILRKIHDDLDAAVFDAYGWPRDLTDEQILERLVALNAERAEEERNGLVRWLRPEFQNPGGLKAPTQEPLAGVEPAEDDEAAEPAGAPAALAAWPKQQPEQLAAVRDLVLRGTSAWSAKSVAAAFKGAGPKGAATALESLAALGLVVGYDAGGERRWKAARAG
jgi:hypothetical protein